jgi:hypothetical protein
MESLDPKKEIVISGETASQVLAAQQKAVVESRYMMALHRPRDLDRVRQNLIKACERPIFAQTARYLKPIGKGVSGPSIRFVEEALRCFTNVLPEISVIYDDREKRIVRVSITDLENNISYSQDVAIEKTVERKNVNPGDEIVRSRTNSYGQIVYLIPATEDDLLNKQNALISKALRSNGLRLIPSDIVDECMSIVIAVQKNKDAKDPDAARKQLFDSFEDVGVTVDMIKVYLGHEGKILSPKELSDLRGFYTAIKSGEATWKEIFTPKEEPKDDGKKGMDSLSKILTNNLSQGTNQSIN